MAKAIYGHNTQKSAMAMAIVASPMDPPLDVSLQSGRF